MTTQPGSAETSRPGSHVGARVGGRRAFLAATAAHLCDVQSGVYDDPAELAAAYAQAPEYDGISDGEVADLMARLSADPAFTAELRKEIAETCG